MSLRDKYPPPPLQQPLGHGKQLCEVSIPSKLPVKGGKVRNKCCVYTVILTLAIWLGQGHDTILWCIIKIQLGSEEFWLGHGFMYVWPWPTSEIWPWVKVMTPLGHGQQCVKYQDPTWQWGVMARTPNSGMSALWPWHKRYDLGLRSWHTLGSWTISVEVFSWSKLAVKNCCPDTNFRYACTMTLTLEIQPWVKVMTHPWVMDNNCVKYPYPTWQWGVMTGHRFWYVCSVTLTIEIWP